jgi:hypothetical protein
MKKVIKVIIHFMDEYGKCIGPCSAIDNTK